MRLFHVSEESNIDMFYPRLPVRKDLNPSEGLVWAINERCLPNFLMPRNCPRVTYHAYENTMQTDRSRYVSSSSCSHVVVIEYNWFEIMKNTKLYLYEFDSTTFELQDDIAGYYISKVEVEDLFEELFKRNVELRVVDSLWDISEKIKKSSFNWPMCRMGNAQPKIMNC